jgi:acyl-CoA dehydrogenase
MQPAEGYEEIRSGIRALCTAFPDEYFRQLDAERGYPDEFVAALTKAGWLAALIPTEYGGSGLSLTRRRSSWRRSTGPAPSRGPVTVKCT